MLKNFHKEIEYCTFCPKLCRFSCPVGNATSNETYTPWGRMTLLHLVGQGSIPWDREVANAMYKCTTCLLCREFCDHEIDVPNVMHSARLEAIKQGKQPQEAIEFLHFFQEQGNPFGDNLAARLRTILPASLFNPDAQVVYFPGCSIIYNYPQTIKNTFRLFEAMDINYVACYQSEVPCCGVPVYDLGHDKAFKQNAEKLGQTLAKAKVIITGCPSCAWSLKVRLPEAGVQLTERIYHITEFLAPLIEEGKLPIRRPFSRKLIYHDPCYLARYLGVVDQPRKLLNEVCREPLADFSWNRKHSYCCGAGGGIPTTNPMMVRDIATSRMHEVLEGEKKSLVTACPTCLRTFQKADERLDAMDIVDVLARCL